tara:strand:- start:3113 stop:3526 length:414 start_codon:yes stop_codon:yes gene_type:complete
MVNINIDSVIEDDEKKYFYVSADIGTQRSRSMNFKTRDVVFSVKDVVAKIAKENELDTLDFIPSESLTELKYNSSKGVCVFKKKSIDILKKNVKINKIIEAESPKNDQQNKASLSSGLKKQTKTKKRKTTKNKTTEE